MRITPAKAVAAIAVTGVALLGAQYASASPSHQGKQANPNITAIRNIAHVFSVSATGGTGQVLYDVPTLPNGIYEASYTANFFPQGDPTAPEAFSCFLLKNSAMRTQSTSVSTYTSGFYIGVNGSNTVKVSTGDTFQLGCGLADGNTWQYGTRPLQATFTRLDGLASGGLAKAAHGTLKSSAASTN